MPQQQPTYQRKGIGLPGLLGVKGKARDVLGTIGDAFLMQAGQAPMYAPHKRREDMNEAMFGFADNPMEAIKRVSEIDPQAGFELAQQQAKAALEQRKNQAQIADEEASTFNRVRGNAGAFMRGANETTYPEMRERALQLAKRYNVDLDEFLPEQYDENALSAFVNMGVGDPDKLMDNERDADYDAARIDQFERGLDRQDRAEARQERNTNSTISSRATRDAIQERRATAYESGVSSQNANRGKSKGKDRGGRVTQQDIAGTLPASRIPATARIGTAKNGRKIAKVGDKLYYVGN